MLPVDVVLYTCAEDAAEKLVERRQYNNWLVVFRQLGFALLEKRDQPSPPPSSSPEPGFLASTSASFPGSRLHRHLTPPRTCVVASKEVFGGSRIQP